MNKEQEKLAAAYAAGEDVGDQLLQACRENPELLQELAGLAVVDRLLTFHVDEASGDVFAAEVRQRLERAADDSFVNDVRGQLKRETRKKPLHLLWLAAAASLAMVCFFTFRTPGNELATLTSSTDAVWGAQALEAGATLGKGVHKLTSGYSEIMMNSGVRLILEAPIELEIESVDLVRVNRGRLVARVPEPAIGFTVLTPSAEVVDLGTEFGIAVEENGSSEVHVLQGEVKARPLQQKEFANLLKDEGMAFDENQQITMIKSHPETFRRALPGRTADQPEFLHWSCDAESALVECDGTGIAGKFYPGERKALGHGKGPVYQNGQFGEALYFNGTDAYVETAFSGIGGNAPRTVAFWAKIPRDFSVRNGYGMVSWGLMKRGAAWQISPNPEKGDGPLGRLRIGTKDAPIVGSTDLRDDRWHHVAIVMYGGDEADLSTHVLLYVDGNLEKTVVKSVALIDTQLEHEKSRPLTFGRNMGYANDSAKVKNRFFKGWIDEIYLFDTALDQSKIRNLMQLNRLTQTQ